MPPAVEPLARAATYDRPAGTRTTAWLVVLAVHALLVAAWLNHRGPQAVPQLRKVVMQLLPPEPTPAPPPPAEPPRPRPPQPPTRQPLQRPTPPTPAVVRPDTPTPAKAITPTPAPPSPVHQRQDSDEWEPPAPATAGAGQARRAPPDYADKVKAQVIAKVIYPANALYPAPRGFKGDPRELLRQCTIPYEVVVDRQGLIVSYEIEACQDELLDAAAEAAILKAQPFAPPPDGAEQYRIYGSINFMKPRFLSKPKE